MISRNPLVGKLLILSDIHGNWPALNAILQNEPNVTQIAFCGDVVDYGPYPVECLRWIAKNANHVVRGNHDNALAFNLDCRCMGSFREYSHATREWHHTLLSEADLNYLRTMPTINWFEWGGRHFRMAHATPEGDLFEYLAPEDWEKRIAGFDADFVLLGHTHVQDCLKFGKLTVVNPGSVGLARDTPGLACYAIYDGGILSLKRIPYDVGATVAALRESPLTDSVIEGLVKFLRPKDLSKA